MKRGKISKATKRRFFIFGSFSLFIILYFSISGINYIININNLGNQQKELKGQLEMLKGEEEDLKTEVLKLQDLDYIARYAREHYLYSKDDELLIRIEPEENKVINLPKHNYKQIALISVSSLMVIYILFRKRK